MIASLRGRIDALGEDWVVIAVGGIGLQVRLPASTIGALGNAGDEVKLYTHLHLREDNIALYGFATQEELALFQVLIGVSGLGPRLAQALLSAMSVEQVAAAIAAGNAEQLRVPGIGKKLSERIILELKGKIAAGWVVAAPPHPQDDDVLAALVSLGYSAAEAGRAMAALPPGLSLEEKVRLALRHFAESKA
ncbi:MAG: Holliday junction branch migration protein RuvA [Chloroflexi bacterium]|nr:Holliday junction branch migration protein RuvA [Chloroflexota bacterium]